MPLFELPDFFVRSVIRDRCSHQLLSHKPESLDKLQIHSYHLTILFSHSVQHACGLVTKNERKILVWWSVPHITAFCGLNFISSEQKACERVSCWSIFKNKLNSYFRVHLFIELIVLLIIFGLFRTWKRNEFLLPDSLDWVHSRTPQKNGLLNI